MDGRDRVLAPKPSLYAALSATEEDSMILGQYICGEKHNQEFCFAWAEPLLEGAVSTEAQVPEDDTSHHGP